MIRLNAGTAGALSPAVARYRYDRGAVRRGVVHLGIGAFHRAHQAVFFDDLLGRGDDRWGIIAASLRSPAVRAQLAPQDHLYCALVREGATERARLIGAVGEVLVAPADTAALLAALAHPDTKVVTLTVTEKGYRLDPASGALNEDDPDVEADRRSLVAPLTAPGLLVAALAARRAAGLAPFTAISCDNLRGNGARLRGAVLALAGGHDRDLAAWIADAGAFPNTMVDRIVPATTPADIARFAERYGVEDRALVKTEPFSQWVIEDRFCNDRPDLGDGVAFTASVDPWEDAKLRLLNAAHSAIAYLGVVAGMDHVHQVTAFPPARRMVEALWDENVATLAPTAGLDIPAYRRSLMARFDNAALEHRTRQIAMDGSQKLPQRLVAPIVARLAAGRPVETLSLAVAGWMRWCAGIDDRGRRYDLDDPLAALIAARLAGAGDPAGRVAALLSIDAIFPSDLARHPGFAATLAAWLEQLERGGARATIATAFQQRVGGTSG